MRRSVRASALVVLAGAALSGSIQPLQLHAWSASDPMGVYCILDKVVLEPAERPDTAQLWGVCAVANTNDWYFQPAARGYFHYAIPAGAASNAQVVRNEWADLKSVAGTGEAVAFGRRYHPVGRFRRADEKPAAPDQYPLHNGVVKMGTRNAVPEVREVVAELKAIARGR